MTNLLGCLFLAGYYRTREVPKYQAVISQGWGGCEKGRKSLASPASRARCEADLAIARTNLYALRGDNALERFGIICYTACSETLILRIKKDICFKMVILVVL